MIAICGAGEYGKRIKRIIEIKRQNEKIVFCDSNEALINDEIEGIKVTDIDSVDVNSIFITGGIYEEEIVKDILERNINESNIFIYSPEIVTVGGAGGSFYLLKDFFDNKSKKTVYSIGIGEDLSFDNEIIKKTDSELFAFDPTPKAIEYVKKSGLLNNSRFHFSPIGISNVNGKERFYLPKNPEYVSGSLLEHEGVKADNYLYLEMKTLATVFKELDSTHINVLKMDIEGAEFSVFRKYFMEDVSDIKIDYICIELHERFIKDSSNIILSKFIELMHKNGYIDIYRNGEEYLFASIEIVRNLKLFRRLNTKDIGEV